MNKFLGENDVTPSADIEDGAANVIRNMYMVNGGLERRLGSKVWGVATAHNSQGVMWCNIPKNTPVERMLLVSDGTLFDAFNGTGTYTHQSTGVFTDLYSSSTPFATSGNVGMACVDGVAYVADGTNPMLSFDGTTAAKAGSPAPTTAPTLNAYVGAGIFTGNVQYYVTYLDANGNESEPSPASAVLTPAAQNITLNLPNDTDPDRSGKNLYRLGVASTLYKKVNATAISATATTYTDSVADASLGLPIVLGNSLFPSCQYLWEHDGRLFGIGNTTNPNTLYISNQFQPWYCPASPNVNDPTQGLRIQIQGKSARLIGGCSHGGYVFIFTDEGGYILQGTSQLDYRLDRFTTHGAASHRSIKSIRNWLFWVGTDGVYRYGGYQGSFSGISGYDALGVARIDYPIRTLLNSLTAAQIASAVAWVWDDRYYISFSASKSNRCFDTRYDPEHGWSETFYSLNAHFTDVTIAQSLGTTPGIPRPFAINSGNRSVMQLEVPAYYLDDIFDNSTSPVAIAATWVSKQFNMGMPGRDKRVQLWGFKLRNPAAATGTNNVTASIYTSGSPTANTSTAAQVNTMTLSPTSSGDDWNITPQAGSDLTVLRTEGVNALRSELFQLVITSADTTMSDFRLCEAEIYYTLAG